MVWPKILRQRFWGAAYVELHLYIRCLLGPNTWTSFAHLNDEEADGSDTMSSPPAAKMVKLELGTNSTGLVHDQSHAIKVSMSCVMRWEDWMEIVRVFCVIFGFLR
ncbi:hypothetical protein LSH36_1181g00009 [Paralvinella palmiformis]|uniref:Uncharacterized protein n=1 Tax=Paralvinella palmiformis TaxID=53620 RepID=A0AAD9MPB5_9ANNE|nr:hypothetical protein LSH36_1181g00009 [Paralvinella palmiformis]